MREVLTILGLIGSIAIAWFFGGILKGFYTGHLINWAASKLDKAPSDKITHLPIWKFELPIDLIAISASYGTIFIVSFIVLALLNMYISSLVHESELSTVDRSLGALFGLLRGIVLVVLLYMPISLFVGDDGEKPEWLVASKSVPLLEYTVDFVKDNILPNSEKVIDEIAEKDKKEDKSSDSFSNDIGKKISDSAKSLKDKLLEDKDKKSDTGYKGKVRDAMKDLIEREVDGEDYNQ